MTDLVINVLTEDNAEKLKDQIFGDDAKIVCGSYSGTYGLCINFERWFSISGKVRKFLYSENNIIGIEPKDLCYYEFFTNRKDYEDVDFIELFPEDGLYTFDKKKTVQLNYRTGQIIYNKKLYCNIGSIMTIIHWLSENKDPLLKSGLSKIYRRGFLNSIYLVIKYKWKQELKNILQDC